MSRKQCTGVSLLPGVDTRHSTLLCRISICKWVMRTPAQAAGCRGWTHQRNRFTDSRICNLGRTQVHARYGFTPAVKFPGGMKLCATSLLHGRHFPTGCVGATYNPRWAKCRLQLVSMDVFFCFRSWATFRGRSVREMYLQPRRVTILFSSKRLT